MLLSYAIVDFHLFYDGFVNMQIGALLIWNQCSVSDTQVTVNACRHIVYFTFHWSTVKWYMNKLIYFGNLNSITLINNQNVGFYSLLIYSRWCLKYCRYSIKPYSINQSIHEVLKDHHLVYDLIFWENSRKSFFHENR